MSTETEFLSLLKETEKEFRGWDFSYIEETGRMQSGMLSWSYGSIVIPYMKRVKRMLDMGTGGGEFLSKLQPYFPEKIIATEGYEPNIPIAMNRLKPLGVDVRQIFNDNELPFQDNTFDLIINRHESYSPKELRRILKDGGIFITQQVGGRDAIEINEILGAPMNEYFSWDLQFAVDDLKNNGFEILFHKEEFPPLRFYDIGAFVYYLKAIPWQVEDFSIDKYKGKLFEIHSFMKEKGYFEVKQHRFIIIAKLL